MCASGDYLNLRLLFVLISKNRSNSEEFRYVRKNDDGELFVRENYKTWFVNAPPGYNFKLDKLPSGMTVLNEPTEPVDQIQVLVTSRKELEQQLEKLKRNLKPKGLLWVTYPKGGAKIKADINRDTIREYARTVGLEAVAMVSVDDTWSALRLKVL